MTAREEDILTNQNLIENGTVIDKLLESKTLIDPDYKYQKLKPIERFDSVNNN